MNLLRMLGITLLVLAEVVAARAQSQWQPVNNVPDIGAGAIALLTDGRILVHDESGHNGTWGNWWTLTPDINGNYATGTWIQVATMPSGYGPQFFGSAVLPDGRYIVEGGENNEGMSAHTNMGAIYDPVANSWTSVNPPGGWMFIGDSPSVILFDGTFMQTDCCDYGPNAALLNASNLTWTATGVGKFDLYDEEGLTLLPNGTVLDVDAYVGNYQQNGKNWETYNPNTGLWTSQGSTPVQLWDSAASCGGSSHASYEIGPAVLIPNGTVFQAGANSCGAGHTAIYNALNGTWTAGPDFPNGLDIADGPAAVLPDGNVLMMASPGVFQTGSEFFLWDGSNLNAIQGPPNASIDSSFHGHMIVLPTGQVLFTDLSSDVEIYTSSGNPYPGIAPTANIVSVSFNRGTTILLGGSRFNGYSQGSAYGDDFQDATNYPIVRFTNVASGHIFYARTHDHNTMALFGLIPSSTHVDIPANMETGLSYLEVVANGIASRKYMVGIR
jgi:hypothetical protein